MPHVLLSSDLAGSRLFQEPRLDRDAASVTRRPVDRVQCSASPSPSSSSSISSSPDPLPSASPAATFSVQSAKLSAPPNFTQRRVLQEPALSHLQLAEQQWASNRQTRKLPPRPSQNLQHGQQSLQDPQTLSPSPSSPASPLDFLVQQGQSVTIQLHGSEEEGEGQDGAINCRDSAIENFASASETEHSRALLADLEKVADSELWSECVESPDNDMTSSFLADIEESDELVGSGSVEEEEGWSSVYMRSFLGLWGGLRSHAKAASAEQHEEEERQKKEGDALPGSKDDGSSELMAHSAAVEGGQGDVNSAEDVKEEDELVAAATRDLEKERPNGVVEAPQKANIWAVWALMTWRREKQEEERQKEQGKGKGKGPAVAAADPKAQAAAVVKAVKGDNSCQQCGACKAYSEAASPGQSESSSAVPPSLFVPHTTESMRPHLHLATQSELRGAAILSRLCHLAYTIPTLDEDYLFAQHRMRLITTSMRTEELKAIHQAAALQALLPPPTPTDLPQQQETLLLGDATGAASVPAIRAYQSTASALASAAGAYAGLADLPDLEALGSAEGKGKGEGEGKKGSVEDEGTCPCHWFVCDEMATGTRHFIIQGSESLASWQANLLFDPVPFEDPRLGVMVHRGIYTAAKALYRDLLPIFRSHLALQGPTRARIQLAGHSLGGSLATLLGLMLHVRGEVAPANMLPIYTFGAPSILCGGDQLMARLGLPEERVRHVMMHRDLVPRAFACEYPDHIAEMLRRVSGALRNHPCLLSQRLVYAPMGHMMVLQPEEKMAPFHPLLPAEPGLYHVGHPSSLNSDKEEAAARAKARSDVRGAQLAILNNPHPLEILADPGSYGADGNISRDHDPRHYTFALASHARRALREERRAVRQQRRREHWMPLLEAGAGGRAGVALPSVERDSLRKALPPAVGLPLLAPVPVASTAAVAFADSQPGAYPRSDLAFEEEEEHLEILPAFAYSAEALVGHPKLVKKISLSAAEGAAAAAAGGGAGSTGLALTRGSTSSVAVHSLGEPGEGSVSPSAGPSSSRGSGSFWWPSSLRGSSSTAASSPAPSASPASVPSPSSGSGWWSFWSSKGDRVAQGQHLLGLMLMLAAAHSQDIVEVLV